jgi:glycosyltransferase involved in cell wall biosynthesis
MDLPKISVVIRNKNQVKALEFLLNNLCTRYNDDIDEIIVLDNLSVDGSLDAAIKYDAKVVSVEKFGYGSSANLAAESSKNNIVVIFSAHAYPVSVDFFQQIRQRFLAKPNLAGLRCIHSDSDYRNFINNITAYQDPNKSGLIFCGSAFNKRVWEKHKFKDNIATFEDKEWSKRVLQNGYDIEFSPSIFCYNIKRNRKQLYFRFRSEIVGGYQLWNVNYSLFKIVKSFGSSFFNISKNYIIDLYYTVKRFLFMINFMLNLPKRF